MTAALAAAWWAWIVPVSVHAAALALLACLAARLLPRRLDPRVRAALLVAVLARLVLPVGLASPWSLVDRAPRLAPAAGPAAPAAPPPADHRAAPGVVAAMAVWAAGVLACAGWRLRRARGERAALLAGARPAPPAAHALLADVTWRVGGRRPARLRVAGAGTSPAVVGLRAPTIVVPGTLLAPARRRELEHALLHEAAHVRRGDPRRAALVSAIHVVFWFHPALVAVRRALAELREEACDAAVVRALGHQAAGYRRTLLRLAAERAAPAPALGLLGRHHPLIRRIERLEHPVGRHAWRGRAASALLVALSAATLVPMERLDAAAPSARTSRSPRADSSTLGVVRAARLGATSPARTTRDGDAARALTTRRARLDAAGAPLPPIPPPIASDEPGCLSLRLRVLARMAAGADPETR